MMNTGNWDSNTLGYATVETLLDDVSKQMSLSNLSRYSRGNPQRQGNSMRVVKPNSASNSPRGSIGLGRRRTVMSDSPYRRRVAVDHQAPCAPAGFVSNDGLQIPTRSNRPMSWHPASQYTPQQPCQPVYQPPTYDMSRQYNMTNVPTNTAMYSGYTSPASTFSPISLPYSGYEQPQYHYQDTPAQYQPSYMVSQQVMIEQQTHIYTPPTESNVDPTLYSHFDWTNFATNGFQDSTAPPTPENFLPIQHPEPTFPAEEAIPYHSLSDTDSVDDDLRGIGLYDTPEEAKSPSSDPHLDNYRSLLMSQFLGATYRRPEPTGKGLKLEETWNPPASDDGNDDDEQDGEGEDDEESSEDSENNNSQSAGFVHVKKEACTTQMNQDQQCHNGWL